MKPIVLSLLCAFDAEPVLTLHNVGLIFIQNNNKKIGQPQLCLWYNAKKYSNIANLKLYPARRQKECFWSVHSAISNKSRTMVKQKIVQGHAWKTCTIITYNKSVSKPFPSINYAFSSYKRQAIIKNKAIRFSVLLSQHSTVRF